LKKARALLGKAGIDIHDLDNGMGLIGHNGSHGKAYSEAGFHRLKRYGSLPKLQRGQAIRNELKIIGQELRYFDNRGVGNVTKTWTMWQNRS